MMTLISLKELTMIRGTADYAFDGDTYDRVFRLVFAGRPESDDDLDTIASTAGLPIKNDPLKAGDPRVLKKITVACDGATDSEFVVTCSYEVPKSESFAPNPLDRPDEISGGGGNQLTQAFFKDNTPGTPVQAITKAGEPLNPAPVQTLSDLKFTITGNRSTLPISTCAQYLRPHAINNGDFTVRGVAFSTGQAKFVDFRFALIYENSYRYFQMSWDIAVAPNWDLKRENRGFYSIVSGKPTPINLGEPPEFMATGGWPLDDSGVKKTNWYDPPTDITLKPQLPKDFSVFGWTSAA